MAADTDVHRAAGGSVLGAEAQPSGHHVGGAPLWYPEAEVLPTYNFRRHENTDGTLVAFHSPAYFSGIGVVGPHCHWLSADHAQGGHATSFAIDHVVVEACEATGFAFELPATEAFRDLDLTPRP